ncbi:MAG TPA: orotidine 5'-phosphate decarboxylase / HUMPS family protein [Candidatus Nanoarchaeia archaeon]|nr:orotidine 5'-phosphate decarboxylase / HUMPS family protein [Candidatus Nanoarchaeia archaeon]
MIIKRDRSIIISCDVDSLDRLRKLVKETCRVEGVGGYKIGFELCLAFGMPAVVREIRNITRLPIIYDHQKAATDIPDTGEKFARVCKIVDAVILFPQAGPVTEKEWIKQCKMAGLTVIVGTEMSHKGYLAKDGGYIVDDAPKRIIEIAKKEGINDFVVPGNKPDKVREYRRILGEKAVFYSPGIGAQGGDIREYAKAAGKYWHAIVGRSIYGAKDIKRAAEEFCEYVR